MTPPPAFPPLADAVLEERLRGAWATYAISTAGLEGREYEEAEAMAWDALQRELAELAAGPVRPALRGRV